MFVLTKLLLHVESSALAGFIGGPVYPVVSALHILAFGFVIVPILIADFRILRSNEVDLASRKLSLIALGGFAIAAATGLLLFTVQASRYVENPALLIKFALLLLAGMNAAWFQTGARQLRLSAALSMLLWCGVLLSGRWIAFAG